MPKGNRGKKCQLSVFFIFSSHYLFLFSFICFPRKFIFLGERGKNLLLQKYFDLFVSVGNQKRFVPLQTLQLSKYRNKDYYFVTEESQLLPNRSSTVNMFQYIV